MFFTKRSLLPCLIFSLIILSSQAFQKRKTANFDTLLPYTDMNYYHLYNHKSGMKVLLIQNQNSLVSGASMVIDAGVNKEDPNIYGLAHFTEHMMFLGSQKYPDPTKFVDFISLNGGRFNGFTETTKTAFFYKIDKNKFKESFDIFSSVFINPRFDEKYIEKEVNSVNSEYERNVQIDSRRKDLIIRDISNKNSIFHKFSTGNLETLRIDNLRSKVVNFFNSNYISKNMFLVLYSSDSINEMKDLVEATFNSFDRKANNEPTVEPFTEQPFVTNQIGKIIFYETINDHQDIDIRFYLDKFPSSFPDNFGVYFQIIFNYKGKGSISDILIEKGYIISIEAHLSKGTRQFSFFVVHGKLTEKGIINLEEVISDIFAYLEKLKSIVLNKKLYQYIKKSTYLSYFFKKNKISALNLFSDIASKLYYFDLKYLFAGNRLLGSYKKKQIIDFGNKLNLKNAIIVVGNKNFPTNSRYSNLVVKYHQGFDIQEKYYMGKYSVFDINLNFSQIISNKLEKIVFPTINIKKIMPKNINLIKKCKKDEGISKRQCIKMLIQDKKDLTPEKLKIEQKHSGVNLTAYYKQDRSFLIDKSNIYIKFNLNYNPDDISFGANIRLYVFAIFHSLRNDFYEETLRQNSFQIKGNNRGYTLKLFSYSSNLEELTISTLEKIKGIALNQNEFNTVKENMLIELKSQTNVVPLSTAYVAFNNLIDSRGITQQRLIDFIEKQMTYEQFIKFCFEMYNNVSITTLTHGAINSDKAFSINEKIRKIFGGNTTTNKEKISGASKPLKIDFTGKKYIFRINKSHNYNVNNGIMNLYYIGENNYENFIKTHLVKEVCGYISFTELRLKQQLGYIAKGSVFQSNSILFFLIKVQGSTKDPSEMNQRIDNLLIKMNKRILDVTNEKLSEAKNKIKRLFFPKDINLKARTNLIWDNILNDDFTSQEEERKKGEDILSQITKQDLISFFKEHFLAPANLGKLSIQVYKKGNTRLRRSVAPNKEEIVIDDIEYFRRNNANNK